MMDNAPVSDFHKDHPEAFASLFDAYYPALCFFAEKYLHDTENARDVVSEVFSSLWHKQVAVQSHSNIKSFLYSVVRNACIDFIRKEKSLARRHQVFTELAEDENDFYNQVLRSEVVQEIRQEIQLLPDQYRKVFSLMYIDGYTYDEVAAELNLGVQVIRNYKNRAVALLKRKIFPENLFTVTTMAVSAIAMLTLLVLLFFYIRSHTAL